MSPICPGQDMRNLRVELYKCPNCGTEVEIFSNETRVKCYQCGEPVYREKLPSCIEWCASARLCLGEERWKRLRDSGWEGLEDTPPSSVKAEDHDKEEKGNA